MISSQLSFNFNLTFNLHYFQKTSDYKEASTDFCAKCGSAYGTSDYDYEGPDWLYCTECNCNCKDWLCGSVHRKERWNTYSINYNCLETINQV